MIPQRLVDGSTNPEWATARLGVLTASVVEALYGSRKDKTEPAGRRDLRFRLALERITGVSLEPGFVNPDMQRGLDQEPHARAAYEMTTGRMATDAGFIREGWCGASPDGLVGDDGLLELKCPRPATHVETLMRNEAPKDYWPQLVHQCAVTGRAWVDFVSYCAVMPPVLQLAVIRVTPTTDDLARHGELVEAFLAEVAQTEAELRRLMETRR